MTQLVLALMSYPTPSSSLNIVFAYLYIFDEFEVWKKRMFTECIIPFVLECYKLTSISQRTILKAGVALIKYERNGEIIIVS